MPIHCHLGYEKVYLPLYKVADTPFHIQGDSIMSEIVVIVTYFKPSGTNHVHHFYRIKLCCGLSQNFRWVEI